MSKTTTAIAAPSPDDNLDPAMLEQVLVHGDIARLSPQQRMAYYKMRCEAAGLDYRAQPFSYMQLQGKLTLYCTKAGANQITAKYKIGFKDVKDRFESGLYIVHVTAYTPDGRETPDMAAIPVDGLRGDALSNAMMKCMTKAKRRATLSHQGLGEMDESEVETIPGAKMIDASLVQDAEPNLAPTEYEFRDPPEVPEVLSAKRRTPRVAEGAKPPAPKVEAAPDWKKSLPPQLEDGFFIRSGDMREDVSPVTAETLAAMAKNVVNHWTSPNGDLAEVTRVKGQLNMYGYFTDPAMEADSRQCFENFFDTEEDLDRAIRTPKQEGARSALQVAKNTPAQLEKIVRENSRNGQMARYAMKVAAEDKAKPAPAKAAPPSPAKAAAAKAKAAAPKKSPAEEKKERRTKLLLAAHKDARKEIDADTLASYLEAGDSLDDDDFESFCLDVVKDE